MLGVMFSFWPLSHNNNSQKSLSFSSSFFFPSRIFISIETSTHFYRNRETDYHKQRKSEKLLESKSYLGEKNRWIERKKEKLKSAKKMQKEINKSTEWETKEQRDKQKCSDRNTHTLTENIESQQERERGKEREKARGALGKLPV